VLGYTSTICWYHLKYGESASDVKPHGPSLAATGGGGQGQSHLFYITAGMQFLVDTGADVRIIPSSHLEHKHPQNLLDVH
jgi:hypothetical protein